MPTCLFFHMVALISSTTITNCLVMCYKVTLLTASHPNLVYNSQNNNYNLCYLPSSAYFHCHACLIHDAVDATSVAPPLCSAPLLCPSPRLSPLFVYRPYIWADFFVTNRNEWIRSLAQQTYRSVPHTSGKWTTSSNSTIRSSAQANFIFPHTPTVRITNTHIQYTQTPCSKHTHLHPIPTHINVRNYFKCWKAARKKVISCY